eukprot:6178652-Pleurochrysis_carterae.AAC.2
MQTRGALEKLAMKLYAMRCQTAPRMGVCLIQALDKMLLQTMKDMERSASGDAKKLSSANAALRFYDNTGHAQQGLVHDHGMTPTEARRLCVSMFTRMASGPAAYSKTSSPHRSPMHRGCWEGDKKRVPRRQNHRVSNIAPFALDNAACALHEVASSDLSWLSICSAAWMPFYSHNGLLRTDQKNVLMSWFMEHEHDPYPTNDEKEDLALAAGLEVKQVEHCACQPRRLRVMAALSIASTFLHELSEVPHLLSLEDDVFQVVGVPTAQRGECHFTWTIREKEVEAMRQLTALVCGAD